MLKYRIGYIKQFNYNNFFAIKLKIGFLNRIVTSLSVEY